jgi:pre-mRNA-splicing factor 18
MKPFYRRLKKRAMDKDVLEKITEICEFLVKRQYRRANDIYLRLSIGNAPWPIGVTNISIHERSAHERIDATKVGHVLNDEVFLFTIFLLDVHLEYATY